MIVRYVSLAVNAENGSVGIDHRNGIIGHIAVPLEKADRQHDLQFPRDPAKALYRRIFLKRRRQPVGAIVPLLTEIPCLQ